MAALIDWLNTNSGAVQGIAVVVLVLVTAFYGFQTWRQAKASDKMVEATKKLAEEAEKQRRDSVRPVLVFRGPVEENRYGVKPLITDVVGWSEVRVGVQVRSLSVSVVNIGKGPALDIQASTFGPIAPLREGEYRNGMVELQSDEQRKGGELVLCLSYKNIFGDAIETSQTITCEDEKGAKYRTVKITTRKKRLAYDP